MSKLLLVALVILCVITIWKSYRKRPKKLDKYEYLNVISYVQWRSESDIKTLVEDTHHCVVSQDDLEKNLSTLLMENLINIRTGPGLPFTEVPEPLKGELHYRRVSKGIPSEHLDKPPLTFRVLQPA